MKMTVVPIINGPKRLGRKTRGIGNQSKNRYHADHRIVEIGENTEKGPGDLRRLAATQTPANTGVKNSQTTNKQHLTRQNLAMAKKRKL